MDEITFDQGIQSVLNSLLGERLALLAGAGVSMASPSNLPSAASIAARAKQRYEAIFGLQQPPFPAGIEQQADYFYNRGELDSVYFRLFVDHDAFCGPPNPGHTAVADLLLVRGIQVALTTNVDTLFETAGQSLRGHVGAGIDGLSVAGLPANISPLLKIHGCFVRDRANMVWAPSQLNHPPISDRIRTSGTWLTANLQDRDLLIVGYSTDWDYLNGVLATALGAVRPAQVTVVNTADPREFIARAPGLNVLGEAASRVFQYVRASAADFLAALRLQFSRAYVRGVLHSGRAEYLAETGNEPRAEWLETSLDDNDDLYQVRRDLEGRTPTESAKNRAPVAGEPLLGLTLLQLQAHGAVSDGAYWSINGLRVRVLRTPNKFLHTARAEFEREVAPAIAPDLVIAVGAEGPSLAANVGRVEPTATIARGGNGRWMTRPDALQELGF